MDDAVLFLALTSGLILVTAIAYEPLQRSPLTEPLLAVAVGVVVGPHALHWMRPEDWEAPMALALRWERRGALPEPVPRDSAGIL